MSFPIIPLEASFNEPTKYQTRNKNSSLVEGHIKNYRTDGRNAVKRNREVNTFVVGFTAKNALENFLLERAGRKPFLYTPFLEEQGVFICNRYSISRATSGNVYRFSATFTEVFDLS